MKFIGLVLILLSASLALGFEASWQQLPKRPFTPRECLMCRFSVSLVSYALKTQRGSDQVHKIANSFCTLAHIEPPVVCSNVTKVFNREIVKVLSYGIVTSDQVCGLLSNNTCGVYHNPMSDWEINLDASLDMNKAELNRLRSSRQTQESLDKFKVIHISDTHVDTRYQEQTPAICNEPLCCRATSSANGSDIKSGYWGTYSNCDVPMRTLESALKTLNSTMMKDNTIDYIIWTGDIQPHNIWDQDKKFAIDTYDSVFKKIFEYLPGARIFPTLGNHEMVPVDSFSPSNMLSIARDDSPEWLYRKLDSFWSRWLPADTVSTITKDGFYATSIKPGLRVVSLNTNFCHKTNFWLYLNSTDPGDQLQWLVHELQIAELTHEHIHIIGHIPPGVDECLKAWSKNLNRIVSRFSNIITGQFYGHTHNSEFEIFFKVNDLTNRITNKRKSKKRQLITGQSDTKLEPISVGFIGPSITSFVELNPAFRIYTIDPSQGFMPVDFETYYMNLTLANLDGASKDPTWVSWGSFASHFNIPDTSPTSMHNLIINLISELDETPKNNHTSTEETESNSISLDNSKKSGKLYLMYRLFHSFSDVFKKSVYDLTPIEKKKEFLCRFLTSQSHFHEACNKLINSFVKNFNTVL